MVSGRVATIVLKDRETVYEIMDKQRVGLLGLITLKLCTASASATACPRRMNTLLRETDNTVIRTWIPRLVLLGAFRTCFWICLLRRKASTGISNGCTRLGVCAPFRERRKAYVSDDSVGEYYVSRVLIMKQSIHANVC